MEAITYLEAFDTINIILNSINFNTKIPTTKENICTALSALQYLYEIFTKSCGVIVCLDQLLCTQSAIDKLPDGQLSNDIKDIIVKGICTVRKEIINEFYNDYIDKDINSTLKYQDILRYMLKLHFLGGLQ